MLLSACAAGGSVRAVSRCLRDGADIESVAPEGDGETALALAATAGHLPVVELLLAEGASVTTTDNLGRTPLFNATTSPWQNGHLEVVQRLLKAGSSITMRDHYGNTLLHGAAHGGQPPVFQALLDAGVDVSLRNNERFTPLMIASQKGRVDLFRSVVERGLNDVNDTCVNGMSPLFLATEEAGVDMVKAVLAAGGDVQSRTIDGWTPLHAAARRGNVRVIRALLRGGSDVASRGQSAITPLYLAGKEGHLEAVRALMKAGADPLAACSFGFSPLYNAIVDSHPVMAAAMLETLERRDEDRGTAYPSRGSVVGKALFQVDRRRMSLVQGAAYGLEFRSLSKLLSMGALEPFSQKGGDGGAAEYVELVTRSDAHLPPKNPARKAAMHRMIARRPAFTARSWLWPTAGGRQRGSGAGSGAGRSRVSVFRPEQGALRSVVVARALRRYCIKNGPSSS